LIGSIGFLASALLPATSYSSRYGCLIIACCGAFSCIPPLLGWLSSNLHSTAAVGLAIALNISWGAPGQIVGVWIYKANEAKKGYPTGHCMFKIRRNDVVAKLTPVRCQLRNASHGHSGVRGHEALLCLAQSTRWCGEWSGVQILAPMELKVVASRICSDVDRTFNGCHTQRSGQ
jgi:hypothetical protein